MSEPIDYDNIDLAYTNYGVPEKTWIWLQEENQKHLEAHPTCEICKNKPSVRITPLGPLQAACLECIAEIYRLRDEAIQEEIERDADQIEYW